MTGKHRSARLQANRAAGRRALPHLLDVLEEVEEHVAIHLVNEDVVPDARVDAVRTCLRRDRCDPFAVGVYGVQGARTMFASSARVGTKSGALPHVKGEC